MNLEGCNLHLNSNHTDVLIRYPLNLAFAVHYKPMNNVFSLSGNETLIEPFNIGNFNLNISRMQWDDVVEQDKHFTMDFKKIIKNLEANRTIYHDSSQRLLQITAEIKNETTRELNKTHSKLNEESFNIKIFNIPFHACLAFFCTILALSVWCMK